VSDERGDGARAKAALLRSRVASSTLWLPVHGASMGRTIPWGAEVLLEAADRPRRGEIWAFLRSDLRIVVHRYRRRSNGAYVFQGDAKYDPDQPVAADRLVGRVVAVRTTGGVRELSERARITGWVVETGRSTARRLLRRGAVGGGVVVVEAPADDEGVDQEPGEGLATDDGGSLVADQVAAHGRSSSRSEAARVTQPISPARQVVEVGGLGIALSGEGPDGAQALIAVVPGAPGAAGAPTIEVQATTLAPPHPAGEPDAATGPLALWRGPGRELVVRHAGGVVARTCGDAVAIGPAAEGVGFRLVFLTALAHVVQRHDRLVVHAAAIAHDDAAWLVLGSTGAGKSTLAYCALRAGWSVLSDDLVVLRDQDRAPLAWGIPRAVTVPVELLDDDGDAPVGTDRDDGLRRRRELPATATSPGSRPVVGVVVVDHASTARGTLEPVTGQEVLHALLGALAPLPGREDVHRALPLLGEIARTRALRLRLGAHAGARVEDTGALLERLERAR
jgi:hypothetical protein